MVLTLQAQDLDRQEHAHKSSTIPIQWEVYMSDLGYILYKQEQWSQMASFSLALFVESKWLLLMVLELPHAHGHVIEL